MAGETRMKFFRSSISTLVLIALLTACGGTPTPTPTDTDTDTDTNTNSNPRVILTNPSFATDIQEIFDRIGCATSDCHGGANQGGLGLASAAASYANLVDIPAFAVNNPGIGLDRVEPNDHLASYLWLKVSGTTAGTQMPQGLAPLDNIDQTNIMNWINTGALNN